MQRHMPYSRESTVAAQATPCDNLVALSQSPALSSACAHKRLALIATILASSMALIDSTVVNVALPSIQSELHAGVMGMQWVVDAYLLLLGSLVLVGGALGDRLGRRGVFIAGTAVFMVASAGCGLAPNLSLLIAARALQGVGAALLVPGSLAIIGSVFEGEQRAKAIGTWAGSGAIMAAIGPAFGGWLVDSFDWRAIFFLNLPLAIATIVLARMSVPDSRASASSSGLDWQGALSAACGLGALTYGLTEASSRGFASEIVLGSVGAGVVLMAVFINIEARSPHPMMPLDVFRSREFTGVNLVTLLLYFALSGALFFLPFTLIRAYGYSATQAGASLLPLPLVIGVFSRYTGALTARYGARLMLIVGPCVAGLGFAMFVLTLVSTRYWLAIFPPLFVTGLGMTITVSPLTSTVMAAVNADRIGVASGINNAVARVAGLLAVAVLGIVFVWSHDRALAQGEQHAVAAAFRAVAVASAICAFMAAACSAATIKSKS
jgi:EmrB/QacA subfamily drug resistance transporter